VSRRRFIALSASFVGVSRATAAAQGLVALRVAANPDEDCIACLYAQESGIFRRLGLDVTMSPSTSGSAVAAAVAGGTIDIGKSSLIGLITAHARGVPLILIAPAAEYSSGAPNTGTIVRADSTIRTARDLSGKTVAVPSLKGQQQIATMTWIDRSGGDSSSVRFLELPQSQDLAALDAGRVHAATVTDPLFAQALATKRARLLAYTTSAVSKHFLVAAYFCTIDFARKNPDVVTHFARGIADGARYANAHHAETIPLIAKFTSIEPDVIASMNRVVCGITLDPRLIQPNIDAAARYKTIPARFEAREMIYAPG